MVPGKGGRGDNKWLTLSLRVRDEGLGFVVRVGVRERVGVRVRVKLRVRVKVGVKIKVRVMV